MPEPLILLPDAEKAVVTDLREVQGVQVGTRNPSSAEDTADAEFVRVRRVGGVIRSRALDVPTLDALVWAGDHERRMAIAQNVRAHLHAAAGSKVAGAELGGCTEFLGPRRMPDPGNPQAEVVMFTVQLVVRTAPTTAAD